MKFDDLCVIEPEYNNRYFPQKIGLARSVYDTDQHRLAIVSYCNDAGYLEPWDTITVNLEAYTYNHDATTDWSCAAYVRKSDQVIIDALIDAGIAHYVRTVSYGIGPDKADLLIFDINRIPELAQCQ